MKKYERESTMLPMFQKKVMVWTVGMSEFQVCIIFSVYVNKSFI